MSKIKAIDPKIIVSKNPNKPYYSIEYYDTADNQWHIGYGSYELKNVTEWLKTDFDVVETDVEPVRHGYWIWQSNYRDYDGDICSTYGCSVCGHRDETTNYCHRCGGKMDGEVE